MIPISILTDTGKVEEWKLSFVHEPTEEWENGQGRTTALLRQSNGDYLRGWAFLAPGDRYVKEIGRKVALTSLLSRHYFTKNERRQIWEQYLGRTCGAVEGSEGIG